MEYTPNKIYDIDLLGQLDENGQIIQLYGKDAVENSIKSWLTSFTTDFIRNPGNGGYLTKFLYKKMSEDNRQNIIDALVDGFNQDYIPKAKLQQIIVDPDYENRTWNISLLVYIPEIKDSIYTTAIIRNFV